VGEYEELGGWAEDIGECRSESDLPTAAREYLAFVSDFIGVPITLIGVGPGRDQVIWTDASERTVVAPDRATAAG
jgi:adenylosuccinate synthase